MASLKALLKRLTGLRGGRYSLGNYITLTVNTEAQTALWTKPYEESYTQTNEQKLS